MRPNKLFAALLVILMLTTPILGSIALASQADQELADAYVIVNTSRLNIRTGPSVQFPILLTVTGGTILNVNGTAGDGVWYRVDTPAGPGWLNIMFTLARGDFRGVPTVASPSPQNFVNSQVVTVSTQNSTFAPVGAVVNTSALSLRAGPGAQYVRLAVLPGGVNLNVDGISPTGLWLHVQSAYGAGWVNQEFVLVRGPLNITPVISGATGPLRGAIAIVNTGALHVRGGPNINYASLGILLGGTQVDIIGVAEDGVWLLIDSPVGRGWINQEFVLVRGVIDNEETIFDPTTRLTAGLAVPVAIVNTHALNVRSGPQAVYSSLGVLYGGTQLNIVGIAADNVWLWVDTPFGRGWINREFVLIRGDLSHLPIIR